MHTGNSANHSAGTGAGAIPIPSRTPTASSAPTMRAVVGRCQLRTNTAMRITGTSTHTCAAGSW